MTRRRRAIIDMVAVVIIMGGFALYYIPTQDGQVGWQRIIPLGLAAFYWWVCRERLFRWLDRR